MISQTAKPKLNDIGMNKYLLLILLKFRHLHSADLERQAEEGDKSVGIMMVIQLSCGEGG